MKGMTYEKPLAQYRILLILVLLDDSVPRSSKEIAEAVGLHKSAVPSYLAHLGARVAKWRKPDSGNLVPLYDLKPLPSVRRPRAQTATERKRRQWQNIKADPARHNRVKALQRVRQRRLRDNYTGPLKMVIDGAVIIDIS